MYVEKDSYGGFLPLELYNGTEYFANYPEEYVTRYNSGTTALYAALLSLGKKRVWAPYFYCPSVWKAFRSERFSDFEFIPYYVGEDLMPKDVQQGEDDVVIVVNYYGAMDKQIHEYIKGKKNIIADNAQAFFCPPILAPGVLNVYSCRKFIGVSDGAYVIGPDQVVPELEPSFSSERIGYICKSFEFGTNAVYKEKLEHTELLSTEYKYMSPLTQAILKSTNYPWVKEKRVRNFEYMQRRLAPYQQLKVTDLSAHAYCYPLLCKKDYRKAVIERKIFIPTLWRECIVPELEGRPESILSSNCLCLPIDQRYDVEDMEFICEKIIDLLEE